MFLTFLCCLQFRYPLKLSVLPTITFQSNRNRSFIVQIVFKLPSSVLISALFLFIVSDTTLRFGFKRKTMLITHECLQLLLSIFVQSQGHSQWCRDGFEKVMDLFLCFQLKHSYFINKDNCQPRLCTRHREITFFLHRTFKGRKIINQPIINFMVLFFKTDNQTLTTLT